MYVEGINQIKTLINNILPKDHTLTQYFRDLIRIYDNTIEHFLSMTLSPVQEQAIIQCRQHITHYIKKLWSQEDSQHLLDNTPWWQLLLNKIADSFLYPQSHTSLYEWLYIMIYYNEITSMIYDFQAYCEKTDISINTYISSGNYKVYGENMSKHYIQLEKRLDRIQNDKLFFHYPQYHEELETIGDEILITTDSYRGLERDRFYDFEDEII
jgi:hypothetical protein